MLTLTGKSLPSILSQLPDPPAQLYVEGTLDGIFDRPRLAVVGSRKASPYGRQVTDSLVREAAGAGAVIISGLALGIDAAAHQSALDAGGTTIAVLACGLDQVYPAANRGLARRILDAGGALVSEYEPGMPPLAHQFIARNRLVSGLSDAVLITEAAAKSGTLHTASFALEQGKTVLAVPGHITHAGSQGTNRLIKSGAGLVTEVQDIYDALGISRQPVRAEVLAASADEAAILRQLQDGITEGNELLAASGLPVTLYNQTLTMLELTGKIRPLGAGHWAIKK